MLVIDADGMKLVDAATLWGHDVFECEDILTAEYGSKISTAVIGPAGEKLVPLASISHDGRHTRSAGRGGLGRRHGLEAAQGGPHPARSQSAVAPLGRCRRIGRLDQGRRCRI